MTDWDSFDAGRCEVLANYMIATGATVRSAAARFGVSKSTVHKDVTERLYHVNRSLYEQVKVVLIQNKALRHLRGGEATKRKYELLRENESAQRLKY